ncbi:hypothetical protein [Streptomyces hebeiensis]
MSNLKEALKNNPKPSVADCKHLEALVSFIEDAIPDNEEDKLTFWFWLIDKHPDHPAVLNIHFRSS